ncbi:MAG: hypothetical protein IH987_10440, partial [Planctomycetes bacterium]|nr:hypothetical protein [Planctomycetota bacterium]
MAEQRHATLRVRVPSKELRRSGHLRNACVILAASFILCLTVGCQTTDREIFIQVGENRGATIGLALADHPSRESNAPRVRLFAALDETVSFQFSMETSESTVELPRFSLDDLSADKKSIDAAAIQVFRMHPVQIEDYPG